MSENRRGPVFNSGRDQHIAYAEQGDATLNANVLHAGGLADAAVLAELQAVREVLGRLGAHASSSAAPLEAAENEAKQAKPDRNKVVGYVETAVKLATGANGFTESVNKLIPRLQQIAHWAGQSWDVWRPTLGL